MHRYYFGEVSQYNKSGLGEYKMNILITGGTGLLGKSLIETNIYPNNIWAVYFGKYSMVDAPRVAYLNADICDKAALDKIFDKSRPGVVIHMAGIANVDYCEKEYRCAWHLNVDATEIIVELCKKYDVKILFVSTNAVFDGKNAPYSEDDKPCPVNSYGRMKLEGEGIIKASGLRYLLVRPILMYGRNNRNERLNTATWLIQVLKKEERVNIVNDVYENPLFSRNCAEIMWQLLEFNKEGVYHIAGRDTVNRYEFAKIIAEVFGLRQDLINSVSSDFFPALAVRPRNTSYDTAKIEKELGVKPLGLREGLLLMKALGDE